MNTIRIVLLALLASGCAWSQAPSVTSVVNSASFAPGPMAPGELVSVFGSGLGPDTLVNAAASSGVIGPSLAGTRVLFDGVAAPVLMTSRTQVNVAVPYGLAGKTTTSVQAEYQGQKSTAVNLQVADTAPGLFTASGSGTGQGQIMLQDYSLNSPSNPAPTGSIVMIYGTGEGQTIPPGADGLMSIDLRRPLQPITVTIGGKQAEVLYAGSSPGLVGWFQANVRVPDLATSDAHAVVVKIGSSSSQSGVTMAVKGTGAAPALSIAPAALTISAQSGGAAPAGQALSVTSTGTAISFSASASASWLKVSPASGTTPATLTVSVVPTGLAAGTYSGSITITPSDTGISPRTAAVTLTVTAAPASLSISPASLSFVYQSGGTVPAAQTLAIAAGDQSLNFTATASASWIKITPASGATPASLAVSVVPAGLNAGTYSGGVTIVASGAANSPQQVSISLAISAAPSLSASPASLSFTYQSGVQPQRPKPPRSQARARRSTSPLRRPTTGSKSRLPVALRLRPSPSVPLPPGSPRARTAAPSPLWPRARRTAHLPSPLP